MVQNHPSSGDRLALTLGVDRRNVSLMVQRAEELISAMGRVVPGVTVNRRVSSFLARLDSVISIRLGSPADLPPPPAEFVAWIEAVMSETVGGRRHDSDKGPSSAALAGARRVRSSRRSEVA